METSVLGCIISDPTGICASALATAQSYGAVAMFVPVLGCDVVGPPRLFDKPWAALSIGLGKCRYSIATATT